MKRYLALDSIRGISACMIVLLHSPFNSNLATSDFVRNSWVFVDFFFVLSGFVMYKAYSGRIHKRSDLFSFFVARIARLWPLHLFIMIMFATLYVLKEVLVANSESLGGNDSKTYFEVLQYAFTDAFLLNAFRPSIVYFWNFPTWSISAEVFCYVVFGVICLMPSPFRIWGFWIILSFAWLVELGFVQVKFGHTIFSAMSCFFIGYIIAEIHNESRILSFTQASILEVLAFVAIVALIINLSSSKMFLYFSPILFGFTIYIFAHQAGALSALFCKNSLVYLGTLSYSIYMIHIFVFVLFKYVVKAVEIMSGKMYFSDVFIAGEESSSLISFGSKGLMDLVTFLSLSVVILISTITFRFIEDPSRRYFRDAFRDRTQARKISKVDGLP